MSLLAIEHGLRPDLVNRLQEPASALALASSAITGMMAALGCLLASLPDRSRAWLWLPAPLLALWLSTIGYGCLTGWVSVGPGGMHMCEAVRCFATLVLVSAPLSVALFAMLRDVVRLRPTAVIMTAGLAVAGMASTALSLIHRLDATIMILVWHVGVAAVLVALEGALGRRILSRWDPARR